MTTETIRVFQCSEGHSAVIEHKACPRCGRSLTETSDSSRAVLLSHTHVHVSPTGEPFILGIALTSSGAKTLCHVDGVPAGEGETEVTLSFREGLFRAAVTDAGDQPG